jgi:DNA polymerase III subunit epsilon
MKAKDINRLLVLDTETTGLNPAVDCTIEVAATLYDIEHNAPIASFASLIYAESNEAEEINQIPTKLLSTIAIANVNVWTAIRVLAGMSDVIIAHRAEFDVQFVPGFIQTIKPWACSKFDMVWPRGRPERGEHLVHLALAHGVPVFSAHRAMADVDTLVRTFQAAHAMGHDIREMVAKSLQPKGTFIALVSYEEKDKAKEAGFQWDGASKTWSKRMFLYEAERLSFKIKKIT